VDAPSSAGDTPESAHGSLAVAPMSAAQNPATSESRSTFPTAAYVATHRRTEPKKLGLLLRGDLDWIVMKCLEKDRTRRYETANGLAADVQRHLSSEPVIAAPPSAAYRLRKFVRKHRAGSLMAAALVFAT